jgi:hypothetical protein
MENVNIEVERLNLEITAIGKTTKELCIHRGLLNTSVNNKVNNAREFS